MLFDFLTLQYNEKLFAVLFFIWSIQYFLHQEYQLKNLKKLTWCGKFYYQIKVS